MMPTVSREFSARISALDTTLFNSIPTQASEGDRRSWLAIQRAVRRPAGYTYLEIGSYLGGSIQPHLLDPWCRLIISIDLRTSSQKDIRPSVVHYEDNSLEHMQDNLRRIAPAALEKVVCYEASTGNLDARLITQAPDFCLIDGDHNEQAVFDDFEFCLRVCAPNAVICFHDAWLVYGALAASIRTLRRRGVSFVARKMEDGTFALFLGDSSPMRDPYFQSCTVNGLHWLRARRFAKWIPPLLRRAIRGVRRRF